MRIVLPGALPEPREAAELAAYLTKSAPNLVRWMARARHRELPADPAATGCMPHEYWQLLAQDFEPGPDQNFATGLGPLRVDGQSSPEEPVWLAELVHVAPSRDGAALLPAAELAITPEQSVALFESVQAIFDEAGFKLSGPGGDTWRIALPEPFAQQAASPALVSITSVNDWWPQEPQARPWRKLVNEIQMLWFDHPVNQERQQHGLPPVNSLWLYGGACGRQIAQPGLADTQILDLLLAPAVRQDWSAWIGGLETLEREMVPLLSGAARATLVLTGRDRIIELSPAPRWAQWLPGSRDAWRNWWSPRS